jgi:hypothetical protein
MSENERDRRIDATWNAASTEEPPPALDAAIRAAARRAVDARPARERSRTWRYPLAAAAVVALLAIGIVQLTPPEQVAPTTVAEIEPAPGGASKDIARSTQEAKQDAQPPAAVSAPTPPAPAPPAQPHAQAAAKRAERAPSPPATRGAARQPETVKGEVEALDKLARAEPKVEPATPAPPAATAAKTAPPMSEPFPAAAPERGDAPRAAEQTPAIAAAQRPAAAAAPEPAREGVARQRKALASDEAHAPEERGVSSATPLPPRASLQADATQVSAAKARTKDARVDEWIKRIRDLKREGRAEEAAKELAAFRTAYGTRADALLPADLREPPK